ncbi:MAG: thiamine phosphate synthase [Butyrivibrio sp.]|jgi:thiamine-phosphate pyrophosphorylase|nr:thiamine phosphate synthase [Butyrivibrio sp.]
MERQKLALYAVTDRAWLNGRSLQEVVEEAIRGGVTMVQLREKNLDRDLFLQEAVELKKLCHAHGVPLLINDDVEICRLADADGVHIGQEDMPTAKVRNLLGKNKIIGVTVHNIMQAVRAEQSHADYLGAGAAFGSMTKQNVQRMSRDQYREITEQVSVPVVAIGGISAENVMQLQGCGLSGIAVISGIFAQEDITAAAALLKRCSMKLNTK